MVSHFVKKDGGRYAGTVLILIVMDNGLSQQQRKPLVELIV